MLRAPAAHRARRLAVLAAVLVVVAAFLLGGITAVATAGSQSVTHSFRTDAAIATYNESGAVVSTEANTEVRVSESTAFVRVRLSNPNGYAVDMTVEIPAEIVEPADLGTVESVSGEYTAEWRAIQNFTTGTEYTRISVTVPAGETVELAPSKARVVSLAWATEAQKQASGLVDSITSSLFGEKALDKRTYTIEGHAGNRKTIPLSSANTSATVEDWIAEYKTASGEWVPLGTDSEAPVYYSKPSDDRLRLHYTVNATVRFTANPTVWEEATHSLHGYTAGLTDLGSLIDSIPFVS